jgi:hypothetical protein
MHGYARWNSVAGLASDTACRAAGQIGESGPPRSTDVRKGCPYANICEHCPSFHTTNDHIPVLTRQREDATALAADATRRGWDSETERHLKLINRINDLITAADTRAQAM